MEKNQQLIALPKSDSNEEKKLGEKKFKANLYQTLISLLGMIHQISPLSSQIINELVKLAPDSEKSKFKQALPKVIPPLVNLCLLSCKKNFKILKPELSKLPTGLLEKLDLVIAENKKRSP